MDEKLTPTDPERCLKWCFVPVFGFLVLFFMADNSGQKEYKRQGIRFASVILGALAAVSSWELIMYIAYRICRGNMMTMAVVRSLLVAAALTIPIGYVSLIIYVMRNKKRYLESCRYYGEYEKAVPAVIPQPENAEIIDINTCSKDELQLLPGIDAALSLRIISDRDERGGFDSVEDMIDLYGIKPHFAVRIMDRATVSRIPDTTGTHYAEAGKKGPVRAIDI